MNTEYVVMKLTSGDEIIGIMVNKAHVDDFKVSISNPLLLTITYGDQGQQIVLLSEYIVLSKNQKIDVLKEHIIATYSPMDCLVDFYNLMTEYNTLAKKELATSITNVSQLIRGVIDSRLNIEDKASASKSEPDTKDTSKYYPPNKKVTKH